MAGWSEFPQDRGKHETEAQGGRGSGSSPRAEPLGLRSSRRSNHRSRRPWRYQETGDRPRSQPGRPCRGMNILVLLMFAKYSVGAQRAAPALARHLLCPKTTLYSAGINKREVVVKIGIDSLFIQDLHFGPGTAKSIHHRNRKPKSKPSLEGKPLIWNHPRRGKEDSRARGKGR